MRHLYPRFNAAKSGISGTPGWRLPPARLVTPESASRAGERHPENPAPRVFHHLLWQKPDDFLA
jgi:hypothetical protein